MLQDSSDLLNNKKRWSTNLRKGSLHAEIKATKTVAIVYLAFCLCWLPSAIFIIITFFDDGYFMTLPKNTARAIWFTFVDILPMVNTMVNPIIYSFSNTQFRNAVQDVWRKFMGKASKRDSIFTYTTERSGTRSGSRLSVHSTLQAIRGYSVDGLKVNC